jgi:hypothetical protein
VMEGVRDILPIDMMTPEERARRRAEKRVREPTTNNPRSSLQRAAAASTQPTPVRTVPVEQDSEILMEGEEDIWGWKLDDSE